MFILFDHGTPRGLIRLLPGHIVHTAFQMGWDRLTNGDLLGVAEDAGFDLLLTTDQRIRYQQKLSGRKITIIVLTGTSKWSRVQLYSPSILETINAASPGSYIEVLIPFR